MADEQLSNLAKKTLSALQKKGASKSPKTAAPKKAIQKAPKNLPSQSNEDMPPSLAPEANADKALMQEVQKVAAPEKDPFAMVKKDLPGWGENLPKGAPPAETPSTVGPGLGAAIDEGALSGAGEGLAGKAIPLGTLGGVAAGMLIPSAIGKEQPLPKPGMREETIKADLPIKPGSNPLAAKGHVVVKKRAVMIPEAHGAEPAYAPPSLGKSDEQIQSDFNHQLNRHFGAASGQDGDDDLTKLLTETALRETARGHKSGEYPDLDRQGGPKSQPKKRPVDLGGLKLKGGRAPQSTEADEDGEY